MGKPGRQGPRLARALRETPKGSSGHLCSAALAGLASTALASGFPSGFLVQLVDQWAPLPVQPQNENASQPQLSVESQVVSIVPSRERDRKETRFPFNPSLPPPPLSFLSFSSFRPVLFLPLPLLSILSKPPTNALYIALLITRRRAHDNPHPSTPAPTLHKSRNRH